MNAIAVRQSIDDVVGIVAVEIVRRSRNVDFDAAADDRGLDCCLDFVLECLASSTANENAVFGKTVERDCVGEAAMNDAVQERERGLMNIGGPDMPPLESTAALPPALSTPA